jgi:hypothetical protein
MPVTSNSLAALLAQDETLAPVLAKAELLVRLQRVLFADLPVDFTRSMIGSIRVSNLKRGVVVLEAPSNAAAARIRLMLPRLIANFSTISPDVNSIRVDVQLPIGRHTRPMHTTNILGDQPVKELEQLTMTLPDSPLREAIASLIRNGRRK